jgi:hypothetical protein
MARISIRAILPKTNKLIDPVKLDREINNALDKTSEIILRDFRKTIRTWNNKPIFRRRKFRVVERLGVEIFTDNEIYYYVTRGTKAHIIRPVRAPRLRFQTGFRSKTRVRVIGSRAGSRSGPTVFARQVSHPGSKARDFDKEIANRREKTFNSRVQAAFRRSVS